MPDVLRWESPAYLGDQDYPVTQYTSRAFHELEKEKLWSKVVAVRLSGRGRSPTSVTPRSTTSATGRSWWSARPPTPSRRTTTPASTGAASCASSPGWTNELRCPFHGFCWNLDGGLKRVPAGLGLPHVYRPAAEFVLPEVRVGHLGRLRVHDHGPQL